MESLFKQLYNAVKDADHKTVDQLCTENSREEITKALGDYENTIMNEAVESGNFEMVKRLSDFCTLEILGTATGQKGYPMYTLLERAYNMYCPWHTDGGHTYSYKNPQHKPIFELLQKTQKNLEK